MELNIVEIFNNIRVNKLGIAFEGISPSKTTYKTVVHIFIVTSTFNR